MNSTAHTLICGTEKLVFTVGVDCVTVDHHYGQEPSLKNRRGVGHFGRKLSKSDARKRYASAVAAGFERAM